MKKRNDLSVINQANDLINGSYSLSLPEIRWLYFILTKVDSKKPQPEGYYTVFAKEYIDFYDLSRSGYTQVKNIITSLGTKPIVLYHYNDEKQRLEKKTFFWFSSLNQGVGDAHGDVTVRFSEEIREYLYELKASFTQINLEEMIRLDTPAAFRIYSWLMRYKNMDKNKVNGVVRTDWLSVEWIKLALGIEDAYSIYSELKRRVIEPAIKSINQTTGLTVIIEEKKVNRKIEYLAFSYINNKSSVNIKPVRPRMPNRPRVTKGSAADGEWARKCIELMKSYLIELRKFNPDLNLSKPDLDKVIAWYKTIGNPVSEFWLKKENA